MFSLLYFFPYTCSTNFCNPNRIHCRILASASVNPNNIVSCQQLMPSVILFNDFVSAPNLCSSWIPCASSFKSPLILGLKFSASQWHTTAGARDEKDACTQCLCPWEKSSSSETLATKLQVFTVHVLFGVLCPFWNSFVLYICLS